MVKNEDLPPPFRGAETPAPPVVEELPLEELPDGPPAGPPGEPPMQAPADPYLRKS